MFTTEFLMTGASRTFGSLPRPVVALAVMWVLGFSVWFFAQDLPNNTRDPQQPLTRGDVWRVLFVEGPTLFQPWDYSVPDVPSGWAYLSQRLVFVGVAFVILCAAAACGLAALRLLRVPTTGLPSERIVLSLGVGLSLFSLWTLLIGCLGHMNVWLLLTLPMICGLILLFQAGRQAGRRWSSGGAADLPGAVPQATLPALNEQSVSRGWLLMGLLLLLVFGGHLLLGGMTPPRDFDVREYHLQGPREWLQAGRITTLEHNVYTSFPFLSEMLSLAAMILTGDWWQGAMAGKLTLACFQILSTLCVYAIARRWCGVPAGLIAAVACLSTPWILRISLIAYAEGAIAFYLIASLMTALLAAACTDAVDRRRLVAVTGFLSGSAMASKYPGLVSVIAPVGLFFAALYGVCPPPAARSRGREFLLSAGVFSAAILLAVGPWLLKNAVATGNPVYPLGYSVFGASDWSPEMDAKWKRAHSPPDHDLTRLPQHLNDVASRSDWQSGLLFALAVPGGLLAWRHREPRWLALSVVWMLATWWAVTHRIDRFWVPVIPVLAVLAGMSWRLSTDRLWQSVVLGAVVLHATFNYGFNRLPLVGFHGGLIELQELRQLPVRSDIRQLNQMLSPADCVLLVGEAEVFDAEFRLFYNTVFDESLFEQWTRRQTPPPDGSAAMRPSAEVATALRERGVTHLLVNWSEILRYRLTYGYTSYVQPALLQTLVDDGVLLGPTVLMGRAADGLSADERRELARWTGWQELLTDDFLQTIVLYRVADATPDDVSRHESVRGKPSAAD